MLNKLILAFHLAISHKNIDPVSNLEILVVGVVKIF